MNVFLSFRSAERSREVISGGYNNIKSPSSSRGQEAVASSTGGLGRQGYWIDKIV